MCADIIENCQQSIEFYIDAKQSLEIDENEPGNETITYDESSESEDDSENTGETSQSESIPSSPLKRPKTMISMEEKKKAVDLWKSGKTKRLSLATVSKRFRFVTSLKQLYRFEHQIETSGTRNEMIKDVWTYTYQVCKISSLCGFNLIFNLHRNSLKQRKII